MIYIENKRRKVERTYTQDKKQGTSPYTLRLCQLVAGKAVDPLWNNDWLKVEFTTNIPYDT